MANLVITNSNLQAGATIVAAQFNTNFSDVSTYINARNAGTTAWDGLLVPSATISNTSNQLVLGTTHTTTLSFTAPAASRVYTIPDASADANFILSQSAQTIAGQLTLSAALLGADGTVSLPGFSFSSDTDTGVYRIGANNLALATGGTKALEVKSNQQVDIGNTKLTIGGNQLLPILQIVQGTSGTGASTTSTSFSNTNLSATITPKFTTSKILIWVSGQMAVQNLTAMAAYITLARGGDNLLDTTYGGANFSVSDTTGSNEVPAQLLWYDSPATTAATTYSVQLRSGTSGKTAYFGSNASQIMILAEIAQ